METTLTTTAIDVDDDDDPSETWAFVVTWCEDPARVGEVLLIGSSGVLLGRGEPRPDDPCPRGQLLQQRPGVSIKQAYLMSKRLSRQQLRFDASSGGVTVQVLGRCPTFINGAMATGAHKLGRGDTLLLDKALGMVCTKRPSDLEVLRDAPAPSFSFGAPDRFGFVGESPAVWRLRDRVAFMADTPGHVLLTGESGVGKELVARALHAQSGRAPRPMLSRNAATLPAGLIDAELFGHAANYPNPGTPERAGLIGEAHDGTLFLDEIGELPAALQAHLLRVLDGDGEYQRLGDPALRRSNFRLIAATNRDESELKSDFLARFKLRLHVPSLGERLEDMPLLLKQLALRAKAADGRVADRFFAEDAPRLALRLVDALTRHQFTLNVRELDTLLWIAITESAGDTIALTSGIKSRLHHADQFTDPSALTREAIVGALKSCDNNQQKAFRLLNLKNRDVLYRLMKKHSIRAQSSDA